MNAEQLFYRALELIWNSLREHLEQGLEDPLYGTYRREIIENRGRGYLSTAALGILDSSPMMLDLTPEVVQIRKELESCEPFIYWRSRIDFPFGLIGRGLGKALIDLAIDGVLRSGSISRASAVQKELFNEVVELLPQAATRFLAIARLEGLILDTEVSVRVGQCTLRQLTVHEINRLGYLGSRFEKWSPENLIRAPHLVYEFKVPRDQDSKEASRFDADRAHLERVSAVMQTAVSLSLACNHDMRFHSIRTVADFPLESMNSTFLFQPQSLHPLPPKRWESSIETESVRIAQELGKFCEQYLSRVPTPLKRYLTALCADDPRDGIVDGVIALESLLFLGEGVESETSHKFSVRLSWLVGKSPDERFALVREALDLYSMRSKIVHGSEHALKKGAWKEFELKKRRVADLFRAVLMKLIAAEVASKNEWSAYWRKLITGG